MPGINQVTKSLEGKYIKLKSNSSGRVWEGRVKKITYRDENEERTRRILFDDGREIIAHENFNFSYEDLDG